jgi:hypothetical protein
MSQRAVALALQATILSKGDADARQEYCRGLMELGIMLHVKQP